MAIKKSITFTHRNPGHWDVCQEGSRIFAIRGEPGKVFIRDERKTGVSNHISRFPNTLAAANWVINELMDEAEEDKHMCLGCGESTCYGECAHG